MAYRVVFAGNPNVGKSTVFNALTGLRQHTGNWTGKTVDPARGRWSLAGRCYEAVDLPGIYSLAGGTPEERVAAEYLDRAAPDCLVAVLDATALERTLALALELRPRAPRMVLCLNLMDEAERLGLRFDLQALGEALGAPVVPTRADRKGSFEQLRRVIALRCRAEAPETPSAADLEVPKGNPVETASALARRVTLTRPRPRRDWDRLLLGRWTAWPLVLALLFGVFYLTVRGANLPSRLLEELLEGLGAALERRLAPLPPLPRELLVTGLYGTTAKVLAVMLPPMAIFFPLFSLLEDLGYLPRAAFLMDRPFAACGSCGRQGLCMCMGWGCNAVGVTGCRIIPDRRERLAAILTNALVPCNGRFPALILFSSLLLGRGEGLSALATAGILTLWAALSWAVTLAVTALLRKTLLRGEGSGFLLELPPLRRPRLGQILLRSLLDRTLRVLGRAVTVAAPAGVLIWCLGRAQWGGQPLLRALAGALEPAAGVMGLTGSLLLAFLLSFPANELLLPLALLIAPAEAALLQGGLPPRIALCAAIFTLFHWPCSTTVLTIRHETKSWAWTLLAVLLPTAVGALLCAAVNACFAILS